MRHGSLFSGIGGFDLAAQWMGWDNVFHCEWNEFGQKVLKHHFPKSISYADITKTDFTIHRGRIDIITGGFPCQPYSSAGKRLGKEDDRHLWPEMLRCIREVSPRWVVGENVLGLVNWSGGLVFHEVQADLEAQGYEVQPYVLPAASVNAPHRRDRVWFVAHSNERNDRRAARKDEGESGAERLQEWDAVRQFVESGEVQRDAPDTDSGRTQTRQDRQILAEQNRKGQTGRPIHASIQGNAPDTDHGFSNQQERELQAGGHTFERGGEQDAADSRNKGRKQCRVPGQVCEKEGIPKEQRGQLGISASTVCNGLQSYWQNFPTKSPLCGGDDGLPRELDNITFSKWRNESIKAYGNAIVPQVALQIFKAVEQYEAR